MINLGNIEISDLRLGASQVKAVYFGSEQVWGGEEPGPVGDWLCFTAEQDGSTLRLDKVGSPAEIYLETSTDGSTWKDYNWSDNTGDEYTNLSVGDKIYFRAKTENQTIGSSNSNYYKFIMSGKISASGNIQTLLKADGSRTDVPNNCYNNMFNGCTSLTTAPKLPATTLSNNCYYQMFLSCSSLTDAPELPATTLAEYCYSSMFSSCTSLTTAPELPATTLADDCYDSMFNKCTSLTTAPELPATTLAAWCYLNMFYGCTSLTTAPDLPATTLTESCYLNMFQGCTSLTTAPELPATTLANDCYDSMFYNCTSLTTVPELPATTLADYCCSNMFSGCTSLTSAPALPATTLASNCYESMFSGCTSLTTAPVLPATTLADYCYASMFSGCTSLTTAPELPATTLTRSCYEDMFQGCRNLTSIDVSFTEWDTLGATPRWVEGVAASGTFTCPAELPDTRGISNIPEGWTKADIGYPTSNLLMHFDGINNTGAGDASHSTDTQTWANVDGSLTGYYLKRPSTTYNTSWDSKGAVLSGQYDQAFWLTDPQGSTVNALSSVDTGSFTYALAFYYDPRTIAQWRGLIGRQGHNSGYFGHNSFVYVCTNPDPYGIKIDISFGIDGNVDNQQGGPDLRSYLTENSFNTIAFAYDESADTLKSFVNGQLVDTTKLSSHPPYASDVVFVLGSGAQSTGDNRACIGKIYDFMMYSEAIDDADVAKIHKWQNTRFNA